MKYLFDFKIDYMTAGVGSVGHLTGAAEVVRQKLTFAYDTGERYLSIKGLF